MGSFSTWVRGRTMSGCEWSATLSDIDAATTHALFSILDQVWPRWEVSDRRLWIPHATGFFFRSSLHTSFCRSGLLWLFLILTRRKYWAIYERTTSRRKVVFLGGDCCLINYQRGRLFSTKTKSQTSWRNVAFSASRKWKIFIIFSSS
jgi:hypothetical protein